MKMLLIAASAPLVVGLMCTVTMDGSVAQKDKAAFKDVPDLQTGAYKVDPYIREAATLQAAGKDKAIAALMKAAQTREHDHQVIVLCRMLFVQKANAEFRRPLIGGAHFLGGTDYADWPLEPIELVDGVPFLITRGYTLAGFAELSEWYLEYCLQNCDWNNAAFKARTEGEKQNALNKLLASPKWRANLREDERAFLRSQIK